MPLCEGCGSNFAATRGKEATQRYCGPRCRYTTWVAQNRAKLNENVRAYRARRYVKDGHWRDEGPAATWLKSWMLELKAAPCADCRATFPACCMDFDHRDGTAKLYNVGSMFAHHYSVDLINAEIAKCDLVCANCHRIRTRDRKTGSGRHGTKHSIHAVS